MKINMVSELTLAGLTTCSFPCRELGNSLAWAKKAVRQNGVLIVAVCLSVTKVVVIVVVVVAKLLLITPYWQSLLLLFGVAGRDVSAGFTG